MDHLPFSYVLAETREPFDFSIDGLGIGLVVTVQA